MEGGSLVKQKSFETLIWEDDMVKLCFVKNLELLGLENMLKMCLSAREKIFGDSFCFKNYPQIMRVQFGGVNKAF